MIGSNKQDKAKIDKNELSDIKGLMPAKKKFFIGLYFLILTLLILYFIVVSWPPSGTEDDPKKIKYFRDSIEIGVPMELRVMLLVISAGALGALIHMGRSFTTFLGQKNLREQWWWWYIQRPFFGAGIALLFYLVFRGLLFNAVPNEFNLYGVVAIAALAGLFSKQAMATLKKVADDLFIKVENIERRKDQDPEKLGEIYNILDTMLSGIVENGKVDKKKLLEVYEKLSIILTLSETEGGLNTERWREVLKKIIEDAPEENGSVDIKVLKNMVNRIIGVGIAE